VFWSGCVNPILTQRGNPLFPRQPTQRTWGQLGGQLDRDIEAAGFVHRRKSRKVTVSEKPAQLGLRWESWTKTDLTTSTIL